MNKIENFKILSNKLKKITSKDLNLPCILWLFNILIRLRKKGSLEDIKEFINRYYNLKEDMPEDFYELILNQMPKDDFLSLFNILIERNIYSLISYLKYNQEEIAELAEAITPLQYYNISKRYINRIIAMLKTLNPKANKNILDKILKDNSAWVLKRNPNYNASEYRALAYKIYLSIDLDNALELLSQKYGEIDYETVHFLFSKLNTKEQIASNEHEAFNNFLFYNKKDANNPTRQMLSGTFEELFLNFDYLYNNISYFVNKLGTRMPKSKVKSLIEERYLAKNVSHPEITGDILEDMLSSYYHKYEILNTPAQEIYRINLKLYNEFLKTKYKSSIPNIEFKNKEPYLCELINLSDPRNLVLGYRAGNCFRINGDASILFHNFLQSEHMRLLSISTKEYKDFAMMLIMRNGNVLIGQGIEVSKWAPPNLKGQKLYDTCREILKEMMEYMNSMGDEIVATIIGSSNQYVSEYNNQVLPFLINPIIENPSNYYNGVSNYQCLLDIKEGKTLQDIKLYPPSIRYYDKREPILRRTKNIFTNDNNYMEIEKRLRSLRYLRTQTEEGFTFYHQLFNHQELHTSCNIDWYITLFDDGFIDSFISNDDERAKIEYEHELAKIQEEILKNSYEEPSHPKK